jgi:hypothetical protein
MDRCWVGAKTKIGEDSRVARDRGGCAGGECNQPLALYGALNSAVGDEVNRDVWRLASRLW